MPRERPKEIASKETKKRKKKKTKHYCLYGHAICAKRAKQRIKESKFGGGGVEGEERYQEALGGSINLIALHP